MRHKMRLGMALAGAVIASGVIAPGVTAALPAPAPAHPRALPGADAATAGRAVGRAGCCGRACGASRAGSRGRRRRCCPASAGGAPARPWACGRRGTVIPGWSFPGLFPNDFPRVAVSGPAKAVSMVWNDAGRNPLGDILMQSFGLQRLTPFQRHPVVLNTRGQAQNFFPAVRTSAASGHLDVTWYTRGSPGTAVTSVAAVLGLNPRQASTPPGTVLLTRVPANWNATDISLIGSAGVIPNFGDYTDNAVTATGRAPFAGNTLYVAWTDGRLGIPQPFVARLPAG